MRPVATRATSSRNSGRNHLGTPSEIKSEWRARSLRIRGRLPPELRNGTDPRTKKPYHPNTIIAYQHALQGVFSVAVETFKLDRSPFDKIRIGNKTESERAAYSFEQVTMILNAAFQSTYDVFLPVLVQDYCGCRVSEIVDATTHDIVQIDGQWCLEICETLPRTGTDHQGPQIPHRAIAR